MELKIIPSESSTPVFDKEFDTIEKIKADNQWPFEWLSAHGMSPYLKRITGEVVGVEIGILKAENVVLLFEQCPNISKIYGIDPYVEHTDQNVTRSQENMDKYLKIANKNVKHLGDKYKLYKETSTEAVERFTDESLDFVLLDGDHSYNGIMADLNNYYPKLKKGGYMFIHDCYNQEVLKAIHEYRDENRIRIPLNMSKNYINFWIKS